MYLAQLSTLQTQAPFYVKLLEGIIVGTNNPESKRSIDSAISEAIQVAKGERNVFTIDNSHYFLVTTLLSRYNTKLQELNSADFDKETYSEILEVLR